MVIAVFAVLVSWKRYVSLASIVAVGLFPLVLIAFNQSGRFEPTPAPIIISAAIAATLILVRHGDNIQRLISGQESRLEDPVEVKVK